MSISTPTRTAPGPWTCPDARLILRAAAPRKEWLNARTAGIGGSDASTIAGVNRWSSPYELWLDKTGQFTDDRDSDAMEWGRRLEPVIAEYFTDITGIVTRRAGLMASRTRPWQLASVDRLSEDGGIVEIKTTNWRMAEEWDEDQVADHAEIQTQHYLAVTGRSHAHVVALVDGRTPLLRRVERDEALISTLTELEEQFWTEHVIALQPPAVTAAALGVIKARFALTGEGTTARADRGTAVELLAELADAKAAVKVAESRKDLAEAELRLLLGNAESLTDGDDVLATAKANGTFGETRFINENPALAAGLMTTKAVLDMDRLKREHPAEYAKYRARVLRAASTSKKKVA